MTPITDELLNELEEKAKLFEAEKKRKDEELLRSNPDPSKTPAWLGYAITFIPEISLSLIAEIRRLRTELSREKRAGERLRKAATAVLEADDENFIDVGGPESHTTQQVCIGCGARVSACDENCFILEVETALSEAQAIRRGEGE